MNRTQQSPLRLRPKKIDVDINRIINRAAKLVMECNQIKIDNVMQSEKDNKQKVRSLLRLSSTKLPSLMSQSKNRKHKYKESKKLKTTIDILISEHIKNNSLYSSYIEESHLTLLTNRDNEKDTNSKESRVLSVESLNRKSFSLKIVEEKSVCSSIISKKDSQPPTNRTLDEIMTFTSIASVEDNKINNANMNEEEFNIIEKLFLYEVEIMNGKTEIMNSNIDVFLIINSEFTNSNKFFLRQYFIPYNFEANPSINGKPEKFVIKSPNYFGTITGIIVGIDTSIKDDISWYLEYISIKDPVASETYMFTCRRWLAAKSLCTEIKLGYTPPYTKSIQSNKLPHSEQTDNAEDIQSKLSFHSSIEIIKEETLEHIDSLSSQIIESVELEQALENIESAKTVSSLHSKINESSKSIMFETSIHLAVKDKDVEKVKELCSLYESLKCSKDDNGNMPIHIAAIYYEDSDVCKEIINVLLSLNVDLNSKSQDGYTPFLLAVRNKNVESVKYFKDILKVDLSITDLENNTALHLATLNGSIHIVNCLLSEYENISVQNKLGETPFDIALKTNNIQVIKMFNEVINQNINVSFKNKVNKNDVNHKGNTDFNEVMMQEKFMCNDRLNIEAEESFNDAKDINVIENTISKDIRLIDNKVEIISKRSQSLSEESSKEFNDTKNTYNVDNHVNEETNENYFSNENFDNSENINQNQPDFDYNIQLLNDEDYGDDNQNILFTKSFNLNRKDSKFNVTNLRKVQFNDKSSSISNVSNSITSPVSPNSSSSLAIETASSSSLTDKTTKEEINNDHSGDQSLNKTKTDSITIKSHPDKEDQIIVKNNGTSDLDLSYQSIVDTNIKEETNKETFL